MYIPVERVKVWVNKRGYNWVGYNESGCTNVMLTYIMVSSTLMWVLYLWFTSKPKDFPPGPIQWPLLGTWISSTRLYYLMEKWRGEYGTVIGIRMGNTPAVAVVEPKAVIHVLKSEHFQSRPDSTLIEELTLWERLGIATTNWKEERLVLLHNFRRVGLDSSKAERIILDEVDELLSEIEECSRTHHIQASGLFFISITNVLWGAISGTRYKRDDVKFSSLVEKLEYLFRYGNDSGARFVPLLPSLRSFSLQYWKTYMKKRDIQQVMRKTVCEHQASYDENNLRGYLDAFVGECKKSGRETLLTDNNLAYVCLDFLSASIEPLSNTLGFCVLYMVLYPEVQNRVQTELDEMLPANRKPTLADRSKLVYCDAVILEVMRINPVLPLAVPRRATQNVQLSTYKVPKGTNVYTSQWCCLQDRRHWGDPNAFRPERHIGKDGLIKNDEYMVMVGADKRCSLGESLSRDTLFLFFTTLFQQLRLSVPEGEDCPCTTPLAGFTSAPQPFFVEVSQRH